MKKPKTTEERGTSQQSGTAEVIDERGAVVQRFTFEIERVDWQRRTIQTRLKRYRGAPWESVTYDLETRAPILPARAATHGFLSETTRANLCEKRAREAQGTLYELFAQDEGDERGLARVVIERA